MTIDVLPGVDLLKTFEFYFEYEEWTEESSTLVQVCQKR
jgi:hypothetical protein